MQRSFIRIIFIVGAVLTAALFVCPRIIYADLGPSLSADEMLEYTLDNLQNRMHELAESNRMLANKNEALRQRIFVFRQEMRDLENKKIDFQELSSDVQQTAVLHTKEVDTLETRIRNLWGHKDQMLKEGAALNAQIKAGAHKQTALQAKIQTMEGAIAEYKQTAVEQANAVKESSAKEKSQLKDIIDAKKVNVDSLEKELKNLDKEVGGLVANKKDLQDKQTVLHRDWESVDRDFTDESEFGKKLAEDGEQLASRREKSLREVQDEVRGLQAYAQELKSGVDGLRDVQQKISQEISSQEKASLQWQEALQVEKDLLQQKQARSALGGDGEQILANLTSVQSHSAEQENRLTGLKQQRTQLQENLHVAQEHRKPLLQKQADLAQEVTGLQKVLQKLTGGQAQAASEKVKLSLTKEINSLIDQQQRKNKALESNIQGLMDRKNSQPNAQVLQQEKKSLSTALEAEEDNLQKLIAQEIDLRDQGGAVAQTREKNVDEVRQVIEELRLKKVNLENSLSLVSSKYASEKGSVEEFANEQQQLQEYWDILKQENDGLQEKIFSLTVSIDRLKAQKQGLSSTSPETP